MRVQDTTSNVPDVVVDEIVATVHAVDGNALRRLVEAVLAGTDERKARERRRREVSRIGEAPSTEPAGW